MRSQIVVWTVIACVTLAACLAAAETAAASGWSIQPTPTYRSQIEAYLAGVSCTSNTSCVAVGSTRNDHPGSFLALAGRWDGGSWSINPDRNGGVGLSAVSCTSASACTAVGSIYDADGCPTPVAERWNGVRWSIQRVPPPARCYYDAGELNSVSCATETACFAVGELTNDRKDGDPFVERWNGTGWSVQHSPVFDFGAGLNGVSCSSARACLAVGGLVERWNGRRWAVLPSPLRRPSSGVLNGVSCTSATACTAVGYTTNKAMTRFPLAARWNGARWSVEHVSNFPGFLSSVSCTSRTACTAVGSTQDNAGTSPPLAARWNGTRWSVQPTVKAGTSGAGYFASVSCTTASACTAVGGFPGAKGGTEPLVESTISGPPPLGLG